MVCNKCWGPCPCFLLCSSWGACRLGTQRSKLLPPLAHSPGAWWDGLVSSHPRSRSHQKVHAGSTLRPGEAGCEHSPPGFCSRLGKESPSCTSFPYPGCWGLSAASVPASWPCCPPQGRVWCCGWSERLSAGSHCLAKPPAGGEESGGRWHSLCTGAEKPYLLPLLAGFLLGPPLQELFGKFFGFERVPQAGTDIIMDIVGGLHLLEDRYSHGHCGARWGLSGPTQCKSGAIGPAQPPRVGPVYHPGCLWCSACVASAHTTG